MAAKWYPWLDYGGLCVPKPRFGNIADEDRREQVVM